MADLSQFKEGGPIGSPVTPEAAVADTSGVVALESINKAVDIGLSLYSNKKEQDRKNSIEDSQRSYLSDLTAITQSQATGNIDKSTAQAMIRTKYQKALASGQIPTEELRKLTSDFLDVGAVVKEGTEEEQQQARITQAAIDSGWIKPDMTAEEQQVARTAYQDFQLAGQKLQRARDEMSYNREAAGFKQRAALGEGSAAMTQKFRGDVNSVLAALETGQISNEQAVMQLNRQWESVQAIIAGQGTEAGTDFLSNLAKPMQNMYENALKRANGEMSKEIYTNLAERNIAMATANLTGDPKTATVLALSKVVPNADVFLTREITSIVANNLGKNSNPEARPADLTDPENAKDTRTYLEILKTSMTKVQNGQALDSEATAEEVNNNLIQIFKGVGQYGASVSNPSELNDVVRFLSSSETGAFIEKQGGIPAEVSNEAKIVYTEAYRNPALQAALAEFKTATTTVESSIPGFSAQVAVDTARAIMPVFSGAGVTFMLDSSVPQQYRKAMQMKVKQLNKDVAPVMNRLIRMDAHMNGSTDYQKTYMDNFEDLFMPVTEVKPPKVTPAQPMQEEVTRPSSIGEEMLAKLKGLKEQGATRADAERVMSFLNLLQDSNPQREVMDAIDRVFGND